MEQKRRAGHIIRHALALNEKCGRTGDRREGSDKPTHIIRDELRWHARLTPEHEIDHVTKREVKEVLAELVSSGRVVAIEEIDPVTRELRLRYFAPKHAPKPH